MTEPTAASIMALIEDLENTDTIGIAGADKIAALWRDYHAAVERERFTVRGKLFYVQDTLAVETYRRECERERNGLDTIGWRMKIRKDGDAYIGTLEDEAS